MLPSSAMWHVSVDPNFEKAHCSLAMTAATGKSLESELLPRASNGLNFHMHASAAALSSFLATGLG